MAEPGLGQTIHELRFGKRLREEYDLPVLLFYLLDNPLPKVQRFGVRIINPKNGHSPFYPEEKNREEFLPESSPIGRFKIDGIDVLVLFRRVLSILDRPVGSDDKPFRMLLHIGMVRGTLKGNIQGNLQPQLLRFGHKKGEILFSPQVGMKCLVPSLFAADRPRRTGVLLPRCKGVVLSFPKGTADGMYGRKVDNVESLVRCVGEKGGAVSETAVLFPLPRGTGEKLIPGAELRSLRIDPNRAFFPPSVSIKTGTVCIHKDFNIFREEELRLFIASRRGGIQPV